MTSWRQPDLAELAADRVIHVVGLSLGVVGAILVVALASLAESPAALSAAILYALGLVAMLACSAAYNLAPPSPRRELLRRFDHAAIFVMIAGTYSPFTLGRLDGAWSVWLGAAVWAIALVGAFVKLAFPHRYEKLSVLAYLGLGWIILLAMEPFLEVLDPASLTLIVVGGVLYSAGVAFHLWRRLRFQNAIWHGFVLAAAGCHYGAVLLNI